MAAVTDLALTIWLCVPSRSSRVTPWLAERLFDERFEDFQYYTCREQQEY